jgi:hypothetical protein
MSEIGRGGVEEERSRLACLEDVRADWKAM